MDNILWVRGTERLLIVLFGGMSIFLGYRLFSIYSKEKGQLTAEKGDWKISLKNLAPGIYFSLFGSIILSFSLSQSYTRTADGANSSSAAPGPLPPTAKAPTATATMTTTTTTKYVGSPSKTTDKDAAGQMITAVATMERFVGTDGKSTEIPMLKPLIPVLAQVRQSLADQALGDGSVQWYADKSLEINRDPAAFSKLTPEQQEKYEWLRSMIAD